MVKWGLSKDDVSEVYITVIMSIFVSVRIKR